VFFKLNKGTKKKAPRKRHQEKGTKKKAPRKRHQEKGTNIFKKTKN